VPEGDFPISYIGEIFFDDLHKCVVDDREIRYWYEVQNGQLVKIGWPKRYARGEFTLAQFKEKILAALKKNYQEKVSLTDADFLMYAKRVTTELLEPQDFEQYQSALTTYAELTNKYRQDKSAVFNCTDMRGLLDISTHSMNHLQKKYPGFGTVMNSSLSMILGIARSGIAHCY
jgi:hypothetical protein